MRKYLVRFAQIREDFRLDELRSICLLLGVAFPEADTSSYSTNSPFWIAHFEDDAAVQQILARAILIKEIVELLASGDSVDAVVDASRAIDSRYYEPYREASFSFQVDDYMHKIALGEQVALINRFSHMPLLGPVSIAHPDVVFSLHCDAVSGRHYFGRLIGPGRRDLIDRFNLKKRQYLGTTSMDSELSLVMCNFALVKPGSFIYDPFVGTGSFLCTAASFGALPLGSDIDGRQMRGANGLSMQSNIAQYGVADRVVDGLVFDLRQHPWRHGVPLFDAILTDPPYGVRAGAKKIGTRASLLAAPQPSTLHARPRQTFRYPSTVPYEMDELALDLHAFALAFLKPRGRLVYWYPVEVRDDRSRPNRDEVFPLLPALPGLCLVSMTLQRCRQFDRWLLVFEKRQ